MTKRRTNNTTHRESRESKEKSKTIRELRGELKRMRRMLSRSDKMKERSLYEASTQDEEEVEEVAEGGDVVICGECASTNIAEVVLPSGKTLLVCKDCKSRTEK